MIIFSYAMDWIIVRVDEYILCIIIDRKIIMMLIVKPD